VNRLVVDRASPQEEVVRETAEAIRGGEVVVMPTDTVYGFCCDLGSEKAVALLRGLKQKTAPSPLVSLIKEFSWLMGLVSEIREAGLALVKRYWPGPVTFVFRASSAAPRWVLGPDGTIALRLPADRFCLGVLDSLGTPIVASSANVSGGVPARSAREVVERFGGDLGLVVEGGVLSGPASTVVDVSVDPPVVRRAGPVRIETAHEAKSGSRERRRQ